MVEQHHPWLIQRRFAFPAPVSFVRLVLFTLPFNNTLDRLDKNSGLFTG